MPGVETEETQHEEAVFEDENIFNIPIPDKEVGYAVLSARGTTAAATKVWMSDAGSAFPLCLLPLFLPSAHVPPGG